MKELLLVKYSPEIFLKGLNRNKFEKILIENIKAVLTDVDYEVVKDMGRYFLFSENIEEVAKKVCKVFGVSEVCIVSEVEADYDAIKACALKLLLESGAHTFKVLAHRADKNFPIHSMELNRKIGEYILENSEDVKVDVINPECKITIEIREKVYIYSKKLKAESGLPYRTSGSTMLMLSGGIDSPVAGYMMARRGVELSCIYYHSHPYTSERAKEKVKDLAKILKGYTGSINLYVAPFTDIQMQIIEKCREDELTIIMRRFMMRIACKLADNLNIDSVTTGESIGQVASQTMESLVVTDEPADRPVFRPLIAMDKIDIISVSRKIDAYETSILPYEDCCTIFVPKHPKTRPRLKNIVESESVLDIDRLVQESIDNIEVFSI